MISLTDTHPSVSQLYSRHNTSRMQTTIRWWWWISPYQRWSLLIFHSSSCVHTRIIRCISTQPESTPPTATTFITCNVEPTSTNRNCKQNQHHPIILSSPPPHLLYLDTFRIQEELLKYGRNVYMIFPLPGAIEISPSIAPSLWHFIIPQLCITPPHLHRYSIMMITPAATDLIITTTYTQRLPTYID